MNKVFTDTADRAHKAALERFEQNKGLAYYAVRLCFPLLPWNDRDDCLSVAFWGLWKACRFYNPARGYSFSTYAMHAMKSQFIRFGFWRAEKRRQGEETYRPRVVSLNALLRGEESTATLADIIAQPNADPFTLVTDQDELDSALAEAWQRYEKLFPSVKARCRGWGEELAAIYQTEMPALDKRTKMAGSTSAGSGEMR